VHLAAKFHHPTFNCSEVTVLTNKLLTKINKQMSLKLDSMRWFSHRRRTGPPPTLKTSTSLCYPMLVCYKPHASPRKFPSPCTPRGDKMMPSAAWRYLQLECCVPPPPAATKWNGLLLYDIVCSVGIMHFQQGGKPQNCPCVFGDLHRHVMPGSLGPPQSSSKLACRSVEPFCTGYRRVSGYFTVGCSVP